jgi:hypothetical protein
VTTPRQVDCVVFDLGGVLFSEGKGVAATSLYERFGYDPERIVGILSGDASVALRRWLITITDILHLPDPPRLAARIRRGSHRPGMARRVPAQ